MAVSNPSPVQIHQLIAANIVSWPHAEKGRSGASWLPMLGVGTLVPISPNSRPQLDVDVQESGVALDSDETDDALVIFEVLSRSNSASDRAWHQRVYGSVPNCQHYVTVAQKSVQVSAYHRATGWSERRLTKIVDALQLPALDLAIPLIDN